MIFDCLKTGGTFCYDIDFVLQALAMISQAFVVQHSQVHSDHSCTTRYSSLTSCSISVWLGSKAPKYDFKPISDQAFLRVETFISSHYVDILSTHFLML
jgi:hypothetical protein